MKVEANTIIFTLTMEAHATLSIPKKLSIYYSVKQGWSNIWSVDQSRPAGGFNPARLMFVVFRPIIFHEI